MPVFDNLIYWRDTTVRKAAENMAVDQVLMSRRWQRSYSEDL